jgi:hypothetical protein
MSPPGTQERPASDHLTASIREVLRTHHQSSTIDAIARSCLSSVTGLGGEARCLSFSLRWLVTMVLMAKKTMHIGLFFLLVFVASTAASANEFGNLPQSQGDRQWAARRGLLHSSSASWSAITGTVKNPTTRNARCDSLNIEEQALERAYKGNKKVLEAIGKAKRLLM